MAPAMVGAPWQNTAPLDADNHLMTSDNQYKRYMCVVCGLIYDEAEGWPEDGIVPGTRWEDVPETWTCPDCGAGKEDFEMIEI